MHSGPGIVGDDGDAARAERAGVHALDFEHVANTSDALGFAGVERFYFSAENRAASHNRILQARNTGIDAEFCGAIGFCGALKAWGGFANDGEIVGILEGYRVEVGDGQPGGVIGKLAVGEEIVACAMQHAAVAGLAGIGIHVPSRGSCGDEHLARGGSSAAHRQPASGHAAAATSTVVIDFGIGGRLLHDDVPPIDRKLLRQNHWHRGHDSLPHLRFFQDQRYAVVRRNVHPGIKRVGRFLLLLLRGILGGSGADAESDPQPGANHGPGFQELATV